MRAFTGLRAEYLTGNGELVGGGRTEVSETLWVWAFSVHDSQNIFANVGSQRAFDANKYELVW